MLAIRADRNFGPLTLGPSMISDYVRRLRASVGHELLVLPSVTVLLFDDRDHFLLARHPNGGLWGRPGRMSPRRIRPVHSAR